MTSTLYKGKDRIISQSLYITNSSTIYPSDMRIIDNNSFLDFSFKIKI